MNIKPISNSPYYSGDVPGKAQDPKEPAENKMRDKLELSEEAKNIQKNQESSKNLELIKQRINSKFYDKPEVIDHVANSILKDIGE